MNTYSTHTHTLNKSYDLAARLQYFNTYYKHIYSMLYILCVIQPASFYSRAFLFFLFLFIVVFTSLLLCLWNKWRCKDHMTLLNFYYDLQIECAISNLLYTLYSINLFKNLNEIPSKTYTNNYNFNNMCNYYYCDELNSTQSMHE